MKSAHINNQINEALNAQMFEYKYRYIQDKAATVYTNWLTENQFKTCYPDTIVISKTN